MSKVGFCRQAPTFDMVGHISYLLNKNRCTAANITQENKSNKTIWNIKKLH